MDIRFARLRKRVAEHRGTLIDVSAVSGSRIVRQGVLLVAMAVAARVLGKELLGVWALINIVIQFGVLLSDGGISTFVIREKNLSSRLYATAFYGCIALSLIVTALTAAITAPLSGWLGYPGYKIFFVAASLAIVPMGINSVLQATLRRDRKFVVILVADVIANAILLIGVISMLLLGHELWSLIVPVIVSSAIGCLLCGLVTGIPAVHMDAKSIKQVADYSLGLVGFSAVNFWARNADHVLIGRFLGAAPLGVYSIAYRIMMLPLSQITTIASTVALPYLSPHQDDKPKLRNSMGRLFSVIGALTTGPMILIWLQRSMLVDLVLGPGWQQVSGLLLVLAPLGVFQAFVSPVGLCFQISGKTRLFFMVGMFQTIASLVSFAVGVWIGSIEAVVVSYAVAMVLTSPLAVAIGLSTVGSGLRDWLRWCSPYFACLAGCWALRQAVDIPSQSALGLALDVILVLGVCGPVSYLSLKRAGVHAARGRESYNSDS